jgi:hypothetical protein
MISTKINSSRLEVAYGPEKDFFRRHVRLDIKYHDINGDFGPKKYDYFMYVNKQEIDDDGYSYVYILILTKHAISRMNDEAKKCVIDFLKKTTNIDIDMVCKKDYVVYAVDSASTATISSLFVPLARRDEE